MFADQFPIELSPHEQTAAFADQRLALELSNLWRCNRASKAFPNIQCMDGLSQRPRFRGTILVTGSLLPTPSYLRKTNSVTLSTERDSRRPPHTELLSSIHLMNTHCFVHIYYTHLYTHSCPTIIAPYSCDRSVGSFLALSSRFREGRTPTNVVGNM